MATATSALTVPLAYHTDPTDGSAPYYYLTTYPAGALPRNHTSQPSPTLVHNLRLHPSFRPTLSSHGFTLIDSPPPAFDAGADESVVDVYYPFVTSLLRSLPEVGDAAQIVVFGHTVRHTSGPSPPIYNAHIDHSSSAGWGRVKRHLSGSPDDGRRYRIINVWRPLRTVERTPLAVCERDSCAPGERTAVKYYYPIKPGADEWREGESYGVKCGKGQKWWWCEGMRREEAWVLCFWDSEDGGEGGGVPHAAVEIPGTEDARERESIEVRCLVVG